MENLIGKKIYGFKFKSKERCHYINKMDERIAEIGTIKEYDEYENSFRVVFSDGDFWYYPADEIDKYFVDPLDHIKELGDGVLMEVSDFKEFSPSFERCVIGKKDGVFLAWHKDIEGTYFNSWKYARPIKEEEEEIGYPEQVTVNMEEAKRIIAEAKGVNNVNIIL